MRGLGTRFWLADWRASDSDNLLQASKAIDHAEIEFAYLYLAQLDGRLHAQGCAGPAASDTLAWYEAELLKLMDLAEQRYGEVRFRLISDHGMSDVIKSVDLIQQLNQTGLKFGRDYLAMFDSTMARFWFRGNRETTATTISDALTSLNAGRWLADSELMQLGCFFPDRRYGEAIYLLDEGGLIVPSFMNRGQVAGMHGYHPTSPSSTALFASTENDLHSPSRLDQVFDCVMQDLHWLSEGQGDLHAVAPQAIENWLVSSPDFPMPETLRP